MVGPSRTAIFLNVQPVLGLMFASTVLGERIGIAQVVGVACVIGGVALTTRAQREPRAGDRAGRRQGDVVPFQRGSHYRIFFTSAKILSGSGSSPFP